MKLTIILLMWVVNIGATIFDPFLGLLLGIGQLIGALCMYYIIKEA